MSGLGVGKVKGREMRGDEVRKMRDWEVGEVNGNDERDMEE